MPAPGQDPDASRSRCSVEGIATQCSGCIEEVAEPVTIALESIGVVLLPGQGRSFHPVSAGRGVRAV
jgi:hypothetical protein